VARGLHQDEAAAGGRERQGGAIWIWERRERETLDEYGRFWMRADVSCVPLQLIKNSGP